MSFFNLTKKKPPAVLFGLRLVVAKNEKVPKDHLVFAVHPDNYVRVEEKINEVFAQWASKQKE